MPRTAEENKEIDEVFDQLAKIHQAIKKNPTVPLRDVYLRLLTESDTYWQKRLTLLQTEALRGKDQER